ncbi:tRNA (guanosine(46)-N7)-methyltransferase TrmB [Mycoplasmopsis lipofaciens]|uniref:tRNA (guanosine(46)-N7)-methyltransferase TrmB n=1 Tax=Mycoplasmopsis lipofaciens TaxID=114884 RepID=UPI00048A1DA0|nr:tRNA (guanosine(46)-N7)-methyltransferase TrmB [Mycoplasmopsis lipofaciens]
MRLRNDNEAPNKLLNSGILVTKECWPIKIDNNTFIEIGMGKGEMIVELAKNNPSKTFYGIEKYATVAAKCLKKVVEYKLTNFKIILTDAMLINEIFYGTCNTIWLTFCDPWPKKRHLKRRLTYVDFLDKYKNLMSSETILKFKSDNDKLYNFSLESLYNNNWNIISYGTDLHNSKHAKDNIMTGYEKKWSERGKNINYIFAKKPIL